MSYWKCIGAEILEDGLSVRLEFKDSHSCSHMNMQLPAETWKDILTFQNAYDEPMRRLADTHRQLSNWFMDECRLQLKKEKDKS